MEPETADDAFKSWKTKRLHKLTEPTATIADGVRVSSLGRLNFEVIVERGLVDEIVTVTEAEIEEALVVAWTSLKLAIEPTAALPLAAYLAGKLPDLGPSGLLALIFSGGNFDPAQIAPYLSAPRRSRLSTQPKSKHRAAQLHA